MAVIGIESSAHTLGIGIVENGKVLANAKAMFPISDKGIIPMKVADFHANNVFRLMRQALAAANLAENDINAIGYTKGPGIGPCLDVARVAAVSFSLIHNVPIFPVNHAVAHVEIAKAQNNFSNPLALYVSGGNSQIVAISGEKKKHYHVYGETFDIGIGNMLDSFAKEIGLKPAWGSSVAKLAENGSYIPMPYTVKGMDFTFTGLLTNAIKLAASHSKRDVAFSLQETSFSMLCEAVERALMLLGSNELVVAGGVAQSARLKEMLASIAKEHSIKFGFAANEYNADNGAMIAYVAEKMKDAGMHFLARQCSVSQRYRIDKVEIKWQ